MIATIRSRAGFALPITIFVVTIVTLMLSAVFVRVQVDRRIAESAGDAADALSVAQSGLETYFASQTGSRPPDGDSVRINVTGGYANVVANVVRQPPDTFANWTYVVRSTGFVIQPTMGSDPQAQRTVAQFAQWQTGRIEVVAAFTAANRLRHRQSGTVDIRGNDLCGVEAARYGVRTRNGSNMASDGIQGSPAPYLVDGSGDDVADLTQIDWEATINGGMKPDYTSFTPGWNWGITLVDGDLTVQNTWGSGILIVTGDLTFQGSWVFWYGIVLVGGEIEFEASWWNYVRGSLVTGLNEMVGGNPSRGDIGESGTRTYVYYDSCYIDQALDALTGFQPIEGGWVDNWASY